MNDEERGEDLCCCEYYDLSHQRNHVLACCCNCYDFDEAVDSWFKGKKVPEEHKIGFINTMSDRLRLPWMGGAVQVAFDSILPIFILPIMFLLASISLCWTVFSFTTVAIFLFVTYNFFVKTIPKTKFFFIWTITSIILLYFIFEFVVIPFLEILVEENIALSIIIFAFIMCLYLMKVRARELILHQENDGEMATSRKDVAGFYNCTICESKIPDKDHHCMWFDCCISRHNQFLFIMALFFAVSALLYSSNLTLTSVCHPFEFYKTVLLPDDCSDVYFQFELGLAFVSAIYSIFLALILTVLLWQQVLLVTLGIPLKDWRKLSFMSKLCLGLNKSRPYNRGCINNWIRIICWRRNQYSIVNREV